MKYLSLSILVLPTLAMAAESVNSTEVVLPKIELRHTMREGSVAPSALSSAANSNDTATLLNGTPGIATRTGGGISSQPSIHGLSNDRVNVRVDNQVITSACPNHMNPALSYIDPDKIESLDVMAGITPVSSGGDSIGGSILVKSKLPMFGEEGKVHKHLTSTSFFKSNNENMGVTLGLGVANDRISFQYDGLDEKADRYRDGDGERVKGTIYNQNNQSLTIAGKLSDGVVALKVSRANVPYQGFVNQYMDMNDNTADAANLSYTGEFEKLKITTNASFQHTDHYMNKIGTERTGAMPMYTSSDEFGLNMKGTTQLNSIHALTAGGDYNQYRLEDWWTPVTGSPGMSPGTFKSIHHGKRDRIGLFIENKSQWTQKLNTLFGLRTDIVQMDTGDVAGYNTGNNLPADAAAFNSREHNKIDTNWDATLVGKYKLTDVTGVDFGYARKTRSPNLYERYAWAGTSATTMPAQMDMRMINWFGDGNGYVGNLSLNPEISHTLSAGLKLNNGSRQWSAGLTPYASYVEDFIDADLLFSDMQGRNYLQFANHDAVLMGADFSGHLNIFDGESAGDIKLKAIASYVRGYRKDGEADLYHLMPLNGQVTLEHSNEKWINQLGVHLVNEKKQVNNLRREVQTAGYGLVDISTSYEISKKAKLEVAVTNLFDKTYALPLGGVDLINNGANYSTALSGMGRSFNTALKLSF